MTSAGYVIVEYYVISYVLFTTHSNMYAVLFYVLSKYHTVLSKNTWSMWNGGVGDLNAQLLIGR